MPIPRRSDLEDMPHSELVQLIQDANAEMARRALRADEAKTSIGRDREARRRGFDRDPNGW